MRKIQGEIEALAGSVLVVTFASPAQLEAFGREFPLPFPIVADLDRRAYAAFGLERTTVRAFFQLGVIWHYLKLMLRGWLPRRPAEKDDLLQLGGDFILDRDGQVTFGHASRDPSDRPGNQQLLDAMRAAAGKR